MYKKIYWTLIIGLASLGSIQAQEEKPVNIKHEPIAPEIEAKIKESVEHRILWYRAALCPEVDFERFVTRSYANKIITARFDPKWIFLKDSLPEGHSAMDYKMVLEVSRWPEITPYPNYYLVKKEGMKFTNGTDTLSFNICNDYFDYDEYYVVKCWKNAIPAMVSGNFFTERLYPSLQEDDLTSNIAWHMTNFRLGQFKASHPSSFPDYGPHETKDYFQFKINHSLLSPRAVLARVPKANPFKTLEVLYYTNDTTITHGDIDSLYEVKYILKTKPETYEETLPIITKIEDSQFLSKKMEKESKEWSDLAYYMKRPPIKMEKEVQIKGNVDTVYFHDDAPIIIVENDKGDKTELPNEAGVQYLIKGEGKRQVIVTEDSKIIYKEEEE